MHKGFGSNIVNSYPAEVACRNEKKKDVTAEEIAKLRTEISNKKTALC